MFDSPSRIASLVTVLLCAGLAACEDSGPASPGDQIALTGTYAATLGAGTRYGAVTFTADAGGAPRDLVADGATIVLDLHADATTTGRLFVPAGDGEEALEADLAGTWTEEDGIVRLAHAADTFLRDMELVQEGDRLVGERAFGAVDVRVTLEPVSEAAIAQLGHDVEEFDVVAVVDIMESFPVQLGGSMTFRNPDDQSRTLVTGVCWPLLRVYDRDADVVVWDQLEEGACALFTGRRRGRG